MQRIVESLASELQRSVAVDDLSLRLLSYSPHYGPVDPARLHSNSCIDGPPNQRSNTSSAWEFGKSVPRCASRPPPRTASKNACASRFACATPRWATCG